MNNIGGISLRSTPLLFPNRKSTTIKKYNFYVDVDKLTPFEEEKMSSFKSSSRNHY